jgi:hypothetical protein
VGGKYARAVARATARAPCRERAPSHDALTPFAVRFVRLSVVICTWNRAAILPACIASVAEARVPDGTTSEIVVVDNASSDETPAVLARLAARFPIRTVSEPRPGLSFARNRGIAESTGDWLVFLDDDVEIPRDYFERVVETIRADEGCDYLGTAILPVLEEPVRPWVRYLLQHSGWYFGALDLGPRRIRFTAGKTPYGGSMTIRRSLLQATAFSELRGLVHGQLLAGEETMLFRALEAQGSYGLWVPDATVRHHLPRRRHAFAYLFRRAVGQGRTEARESELAPGRFSVLGVPGWMLRSFAAAVARAARSVLLRHPAWGSDTLMVGMRIGAMLESRRQARRA